MKKLIALLLALCLMAALVACGGSDETTTTTTAEVTTTEEPTTTEAPAVDPNALVITDGVVTGSTDSWCAFLQETRNGSAAEITVLNTEAGVTTEATLCFDGTAYTITDAAGSRTYSQLLYLIHNPEATAEYDFGEFYLLTDNADLTYEDVLAGAAEGSELVYADHLTFDRAEVFGEIPEEYQVGENIQMFLYASFGENGFSKEGYTTTGMIAAFGHDYTFGLNDGVVGIYEGILGWTQGKMVVEGDEILREKDTDRLPEDTNVMGVFDYDEDTFVMVRFHRMGDWKLNAPQRTYQGGYNEIIVTAYEDGAPVWQTTGPVFVD